MEHLNFEENQEIVAFRQEATGKRQKWEFRKTGILPVLHWQKIVDRVKIY